MACAFTLRLHVVMLKLLAVRMFRTEAGESSIDNMNTTIHIV
jgi:hypothetical protein